MLPQDQPALPHNLLLKGELLQVSVAFEAAQIPCVVLKGLPLAIELYGGIGARAMLDNDVLVRRSDGERAHQVLTTLGFKSETPGSFQRSFSGNFQHPLHRSHPGGGVSNLDLHWAALAPHLFAEHEALWFEETRDFELDGRTLRVPSRELGLIHLAGHLLQHSLGQPRILKDIGLAWQAWRDQIEVPRLRSLAELLGATAALDYALRAANLAGHCSVPSPRLLFSARASLLLTLLPVERLLDPKQPVSYRRAALSWLLLSPAQGARSLQYELLPHWARMELIHPGDGPLRLALRYAERPFRALRHRSR
ncbi:MAG: hypothetical protein RJA70_182 [Pseudomonadota bacterium]